MRLDGHKTGYSLPSFITWVTTFVKREAAWSCRNGGGTLHLSYPFSSLGCKLLFLHHHTIPRPKIVGYRLPFDVSISPLPRLPIEMWEYILDWIGADSESSPETRTLHACALVCRSWHNRARLHLYRYFDIEGDRLPKLRTTLSSNSNISLSSTTTIMVNRTTKPISALFTIPKSGSLRYLRLLSLDLTKEHSVITRGPLSRFVSRLELVNVRSCTVSNFLRFLNSFRSLTTLLVVFYPINSSLQHNGQVLPSPHPVVARSVKDLRLSAAPGLDLLIDWYIREDHFLVDLKKLSLERMRGLPLPGDRPHFDGPIFISLLEYCANTLEDLTLSTTSSEASVLDEISGTGTF